MNQPLFVIGIDGGGTKTTAVLCALDGTLLAEAQGGPSNFQIIGIEQSASTILDLIETCCHSVGCSVSEIGSVAAGVAGAGREYDQKRMLEGVLFAAQTRNHVIQKVIIESDARIALEGAFSGKPGIIVIAGTGSIVFGKDRAGRMYRAGGWGRLVGDEGSGYAIGREAFRAVLKALEGRGETKKLMKLFMEKTGLETQDAIIQALYKDNFDIASAAPLVIESASKGDAAAKCIISDACADVVDQVELVVRKMKKSPKLPTRTPISFAGGLLSNDNYYSRKLRASLKRSIQSVSIRSAESSPVMGAAFLAIENLKE